MGLGLGLRLELVLGLGLRLAQLGFESFWDNRVGVGARVGFGVGRWGWDLD